MRTVFAVVPDLFFATRIVATARTLGVELALVPAAQLLARCAQSPPALVLVDLHAPGDPVGLVRALKSDPATRAIAVTGFYSHVESALRTAALEAGIDEALPRSAFVNRLPGLLTGESAPTREGTPS